MNLPNKITLFRVILVPVFILTMYLFPENNLLSFIIFSIAALSDAMDGYIARKHNLVTNFGKFMDPLADKILTMSAFVMLVERGAIAAWIIIVVLTREFAITGFRTLASDSGVTIAASNLGKIKTITQMVAIIAYFVVGESTLFTILVYAMLIATIVSGYDYIVKNINLLKDN